MLSRSATVNISITLLIILIIGGVVFVVLLLAGSGVINLGFSFFKQTANSTSYGGGGSNIISSNKVEFIAYNCTGASCKPFSPGVYFWYVDYNGLNLSTNASEPINFTEVQGTYLFHPYPITYAGKTYVPYNGSENLPTGYRYHVYYNYYSTTTTFKEYGLPRGYVWNITYNGNTVINTTSQTASYSAISFITLNGPHAVAVPSPINSSHACNSTYYSNLVSGSVTAGTTTSVSFTSSTMCTTPFAESGLPSLSSPSCTNLAKSWQINYSGYRSSASLGQEINFTTRSGPHTFVAYGLCSCDSNFYVPSSSSPVHGTVYPGNITGTLNAGYYGQPETIYWQNTGPC